MARFLIISTALFFLGCGSSPSGPRTVSGALSTRYIKDDGSSTTVPGWPTEMQGATVTALLVPSSVADAGADGYITFPVTVAADGTFSVSDVPSGTYYLQVDLTIAPSDHINRRTLYQQTTDKPDLTVEIHGRPDRVPLSKATPVQVNVTGLAPTVGRGQAASLAAQVLLFSAQGNSSARPFGITTLPAGTTSLANTFDLDAVALDSFLPDGSRGDVTYLYERNHANVSSGAGQNADLYFLDRFLRSTNFTVLDGAQATLTGAMTTVAANGSLGTSVKGSAFAALAPAIHPSAKPAAGQILSIDVFTGPEIKTSLLLNNPETSLAFLILPNDPATDVDAGSVSFGHLPEPSWGDVAQFFYSYDVTLPAPAGDAPFATSGQYLSLQPPTAATGFAPSLSPVRTPMLNGLDASAALTGVGTQPEISWTPPANGSASHYVLTISSATQPTTVFVAHQQGVAAVPPGAVQELDVILFDTTSFKVPPGILRSGLSYSADITAIHDAATLGTPPLTTLLPSESVDRPFGLFKP